MSSQKRISAQSFYLIESLLYEGGTYPFLESHLTRLQRSAEHFGFAYSLEAILEALNLPLSEQRPQKVRLELHKDGKLIRTENLILPLKTPVRVCLSSKLLSSSEPFLRYKTSKRELYEQERAKLLPLFEGFDVLFKNERHEICEGGISNIFIEKDNQLYTPPLSSGLLEGVMRAHILKTKNAFEKILSTEDLLQADRLFITNAVRGLVEATLVTEHFKKPLH